jgi:outer membrane immunogenic protein
MKKIALAAAAASMMFAGAASAADLAARPYTKAPPPPVAAIASWTGCYIGVQGGWAWGRSDGAGRNAIGTPLSGPDYAFDIDGGLGGGHIGCQWQTASRIVIGIEGDIEGADIHGRSGPLLAAGSIYSFDTKIDWMGSVRGRLGYAFDSVMIYATGGWAFAHQTNTYAFQGFPPFWNLDRDNNGWTAGAGIEGWIVPNLSWRAEYRYTELERNHEVNILSNASDDPRVRFHAVRAGISYHFNWAQPVVAKY